MKKVLKKILNQIKKNQGGADFVFNIGYPKAEEYGHFWTNYALILAKLKKANPRVVAEEILQELQKNPAFLENFRGEIAGAGFINFWIKDEKLLQELERFLGSLGEKEITEIKRGQKIVVEFAHPNPFKSFHVGHLRNIVLGEALARILEYSGAQVLRVNYQGDIGLHVAKFFWGMKNIPVLNSQEELKSTDQKVDYLARCYVAGAKAYKESSKAKKEIQAINQKLYQRDKLYLKDWKEKRKWSLDKFEEIYRRVSTKFDKLYFESELEEEGLAIAKKAWKKGILKKDAACLIFDGEKYGLNKRVFMNRLGLPTYEAKELALAYREFKDFGEIDQNIHVVANEQINFFRVTFLVEKLLARKLFAEKQFHLAYGFVNLKGTKMSSREGNVVLGEQVIDLAKEKIEKLIRKNVSSEKERARIAEAVAVGAVKYSFLKINTKKDLVFDLEESVRMEGQSGPYVMYSYVRAVNILKQSSVAEQKLSVEFLNNYKLEKEERKLIYNILKFPEVFKGVVTDFQLAPLAEYAYKLANAFASFYDKHPVLREKDKAIRSFRIKTVRAFQKVQGRCLELLGMEKLEKM